MLLRVSVGGRNALEGIPNHMVVDRLSIRREVALKHTALRTKLLNAILEEGTPRLRQHLRPCGSFKLIKAKSKVTHTQTTKLHKNIRALSEVM